MSHHTERNYKRGIGNEGKTLQDKRRAEDIGFNNFIDLFLQKT